jgi:hypothetical protein
MPTLIRARLISSDTRKAGTADDITLLRKAETGFKVNLEAGDMEEGQQGDRVRGSGFKVLRAVPGAGF